MAALAQALKWLIMAFSSSSGFENIQQLSYLQDKFRFFFMLCYGDCHTAEQLKIKHQQYGKDEAIVSVLGTDSISPPFQDVLQYLAPSWEGRPLLQCHGQQVCRLRSVWIIPPAHSDCRVLPSSESFELEATGAC